VPKVETPLLMPKCRNAETCRNAEIAEIAEIAEMPKMFQHFDIVSA